MPLLRAAAKAQRIVAKPEDKFALYRIGACPQDKFVVLSRATLLRAFGADAGVLELHRRFRLECPHPGRRSPVLELWVRFVEPRAR